ncbi:NAD(P)-dependent oxidoreductase, partial [bacterium]|nr:NAD(P)-dependent oxidoreductase [bacterium]
YTYVIRKSGSKSRLLHFPKFPMLVAMRICFWLGLSPLGPYQYKMIASNFVFNTQKIKEQLGFHPTLNNEEMLFKAYEFYHQNKTEIHNRTNVSAHNSVAKMGIIKLLKWLM